MWGLWNAAIGRVEFPTARALGAELLRLAAGATLPASYRKRAHNVQGRNAFWSGEWVAARTHFEQSLALEEAPQWDVLDFYGYDPGVSSRSCLACVLWCLGSPDQALGQSEAALAAARQRAHLPGLALALHYAVWVHWQRAEVPAMLAHVEELLTLACREHFPYWRALATMWHGWALTVQGQPAAGIAQLHQGLAACRASGADPDQLSQMALLVDAYRHAGQTAAGLRLVAQVQPSMARTGERFSAIELLRLQGELLLQQASPDVCQAEHCFQQALTLAQHQQARALELRAALRLSRLWQQQGQPAAATALLAPLYHGFTEGLDTADLQEARAFLDT